MSTRLSYTRARILFLLLGITVAGSQAAFAWDRGAAPTEVLAPLLYIPVFAGAIIWALPGGLVTATASSAVYTALLAEQSAVIGLRSFLVLLSFRVGFYYLFAVMTALGMRYVEARLHKLELYDQVDDLTGLFNPAFLLQDTDLEKSRADRYQTLFSLVTLEVDAEAFAGASSRRRRGVLKELADRLEGAVRKVDRVARVDDGTRDRFMHVLPETSREGARVFAGRLHRSASGFLAERGCKTNGAVTVTALTYPDDGAQLESVRREVAVVEARRRVLEDNG